MLPHRTTASRNCRSRNFSRRPTCSVRSTRATHEISSYHYAQPELPFLACQRDGRRVTVANHNLETPMKFHKSIALVAQVASIPLAFGLWAATTAQGQTADPRVADLVRAGKLYVGLFLPQYGKGPDGLKTSVWVETARAYATRVGIPLVVVEHATPPEAIACLKAGACDLLFLPLDARAAGVGDFSNPIFQFDYTLMVPAGSTIAKVADVDRPGARIAAVRNHASTNEFVRQVKQAEFVYAETPEQALALLRDGKADALASARPDLLLLSTKLAG